MTDYETELKQCQKHTMNTLAHFLPAELIPADADINKEHLPFFDQLPDDILWYINETFLDGHTRFLLNQTAPATARSFISAEQIEQAAAEEEVWWRNFEVDSGDEYEEYEREELWRERDWNDRYAEPDEPVYEVGYEEEYDWEHDDREYGDNA